MGLQLKIAHAIRYGKVVASVGCTFRITKVTSCVLACTCTAATCMEPSPLQEVLDLYDIQSCVMEHERLKRMPTGEYMVELGAAAGSTLRDLNAGLFDEMASEGSGLTMALSTMTLISVGETVASVG